MFCNHNVVANAFIGKYLTLFFRFLFSLAFTQFIKLLHTATDIMILLPEIYVGAVLWIKLEQHQQKNELLNLGSVPHFAGSILAQCSFLESFFSSSLYVSS